jgi:hypothetical protein
VRPYRVRGTYLESCNCDAICPCRTIDGTRGGRSTYGFCLGALSWRIEEGHAEGVDLSGLGVVLALSYDDDAAGSPWTFVLYVDQRGDERQREALAEIFLGRRRGSVLEHFPWAWKQSNLVAVRPSKIEIDHTPGRGWFRSGDSVRVRVSGPYSGDQTVTCVIPGHARDGREVVVEELTVRDGPLEFELTARCGYESTFEYAGDGS